MIARFRHHAVATATATALLLSATSALALGPDSYDASSVTIDGLLGTMEVTVDPAATRVTLAVTGPERWLEEVSVRQDGDRLRVVQDDRPDRNSMRRRDDWLDLRLTVPAGTALTIEDYIGEGRIGDLEGPLTLDDIQSGKLTAGRVTDLDVGISGSGDVTVASATTADIAINGSGDVEVGDVAKDVSVAISGSGDVQVGRTTGQASLKINGSGNVEVASVDGPVSAAISGSGDIVVKGGTADPLTIGISGSGSVVMDGIARNQSISQSGSGTVRIRNSGR